jgi:putative transposase
MRKSKFTESQIVGILGEGEAGLPVAELCRKHGISNATYYQWKSKNSGVSASDGQRPGNDFTDFNRMGGGNGH